MIGGVYDVVVFGAGYAGFAAAQHLEKQGQRVLVVDRFGAALWESGWAMDNANGKNGSARWLDFMRQLTHGRPESIDEEIDGAIAEVVASEFFTAKKIDVLYYAAPIAVRCRNDLLAAVILTTRSKLLAISAKKWIDATEQGELIALLDPNWVAREPATLTSNLFFQHKNWADNSSGKFECPSLGGSFLQWGPTKWFGERCLSVQTINHSIPMEEAWLRAMQANSAGRWSGPC